MYCGFLLKELSFSFVDSPLAYSRKLKRLKRKHDSGSSPAPGVVQNVGASVKKQGKQHEN